MEPDAYTKEDIAGEKNAEQRRCILEILGASRFAELLDLEELDSFTEDRKQPLFNMDELKGLEIGEINKMHKNGLLEQLYDNPITGYDTFEETYRLVRSREKDELAEDYLYFVHVVCPSTGRNYYMGVPGKTENGEDMKTAKQAVAWTFSMTAEEYDPIAQS